MKQTFDIIILTIIIPIYNCEKYIENCLISLYDQINSYKNNVEIIIIDDGSIDKTNDIIKKYDDGNLIKVLTKKNGGVSSARNVGLRAAKGLYITFVDADDWVSNDYLQTIFDSILKKPDVIIFNFNRCSAAVKSSVILNNNKKMTLEDKFISYPITMNSVCNKVFKYEIIRNNDIFFDERLVAAEDLLFIISVINLTSNILFIDKILYNYRINRYSATQNLNIVHIESTILATKKMEAVLKRRNDFLRFIAYQKLFSKRPYLTEKKYYNYKKWLEIFPEVNYKTFFLGNRMIDKILYIFILIKLHSLGYIIVCCENKIRYSTKKIIGV